MKEAALFRLIFGIGFRLGFGASTPCLKLVEHGIRIWRVLLRFLLLLVVSLIVASVKIILSSFLFCGLLLGICLRPLLFIVLRATVLETIWVVRILIWWLVWILCIGSPTLIVLVGIWSTCTIEILVGAWILRIIITSWWFIPETLELIFKEVFSAFFTLLIPRILFVKIIWGLMTLIVIPALLLLLPFLLSSLVECKIFIWTILLLRLRSTSTILLSLRVRIMICLSHLII